FSSRRRHTRSKRDWSSDVCSSDLGFELVGQDRLRIVEQSAHQGGFAVVDGPGGGEAQQRLRFRRRVRRGWSGGRWWCRHQKYPRSEERRVGTGGTSRGWRWTSAGM